METNCYAAKIRQQGVNVHGQARLWTDVTVEEMKVFMEMLMLMRIYTIRDVM